MTTIERHSYKKINDQWEITKTVKLYYKRIPYSLSSLSACSVKLEECLTPDILTPKYREENQNNPMYGHCYHTTQAMFYLLDTDTLDIMCGTDWRDDKHWWLRDRETGYDVDMTSDQYYSIGKEPPYDNGKVSKWYGWKGRPHMRSLKLIKKMQPLANISTEWYTN